MRVVDDEMNENGIRKDLDLSSGKYITAGATIQLEEQEIHNNCHHHR